MKKIVISVLAIFLLFSCQKIEQPAYKDGMLINNDLKELKTRIVKKTSTSPTFIAESMLKTTQTGIEIVEIAELLPPSYNGEILQASHIRIVNNHAYIAYNTQGPRFLGGVDVVSISNPNNPVLISNATFIDPETNAGKDISSIDVEPQGAGVANRVWVVGAEEDNPELSTPAILERYELNAANQFKHVGEARRWHDLPGYVGTDVKFYGNKVYATSATGGGLSILNNGLNNPQFFNLTNARSVDVNANYTIALGGNPGGLYRPNFWYQYIGGANDPEAKSMVRLFNNYALVALGDEGLHCYDLASGTPFSPTSTLPRPTVPEGAIEPLEYVTNGVSINNGWVYIANGAGGLDIAKLNGNQLEWLGNIDLGASANFVEVGSGYIFVATGLGGLRILKVTEK